MILSHPVYSKSEAGQQLKKVLIVSLLLVFRASLRGAQTGVLAFESDEFNDESEFVSELSELRSGGDDNDDLPPMNVGGISRGSERAAIQTGGGPVDKDVKFALEHALLEHGTKFTLAGHFTAVIRTSMQGSQKLLKRLQLDRLDLSGAERAAFKELVASDGFYRIRAPINVEAPSGSSQYVLGSVKARCLAAAQLAEHIELHMDRAGNILALNYFPEADCLQPYGNIALAKWQFKTSTAVKKGKKASKLTPAAEELDATIAPAAGQSLEGGEGSDKKLPEKTFWQKYWLYIIPGALVLINSLVAGAPQEGQAGGGGAQRAAPGARRR